MSNFADEKKDLKETRSNDFDALMTNDEAENDQEIVDGHE
jgi:hypothetical protein